MEVDGIQLDGDSIVHLLDNVVTGNDRDIDAFQKLAGEHLRGLDDKAPSGQQSLQRFQSSMESYVSRVVEDTTEAMVNEVTELYAQHRAEYARSSNPDFAEFPAKDIIDDAIDDADMAIEVERRFKLRIATEVERRFKSRVATMEESAN